MLNLSSKLTLSPETIKSPNLCSHFDEADLQRLGQWVFEGYSRDLESRRQWYKRNEAGMNLALQMQKDKSFPWAGCSNVAFPLVTIAAMQFHSRAYPTLIQGPDVVKCRLPGGDPEGTLIARSSRISQHMSWQCLEQDQAWEEQHDRAILNVGIVGCNFIKSFHAARDGYNKGELVLAKDLVLAYFSKSVETAPRKSHIIALPRNDIYEKVKRGVFRNVLSDPWYTSPAVPSAGQANQQQIDQDRRQGVNPPVPDETTAFIGIEQHVEVDLDQDGYAEPYIITIEENSQCVLRIVTGFDREEDIDRTSAGEVICIRALQYFTKIPFIPSPDGGIYDIGFGVLLGPLNESVNTAINQIFDAGTMATTAGGFLARGAKIRGGVYTFAPMEWKRVDSTGDDLRKSVFPLPVREPSPILFQLLSLLIDYTNRISGSTDMMVGENPGQNTPAETSRAMIEQGSKIFNAIFKRVWRAFKEEFKKLYILNAIYLPESSPFGAAGTKILREDYLGDPNTVAPAADPNVTSTAERWNQAQAVKASAVQTPGYNQDEVEKFYLQGLKLDNATSERLFPGTQGKPPGPSEKVQIAMMKMEADKANLKFKQMQFIAELQEQRRLNDADILKIQADVQIAMATVAGDEQDRRIGALNATIGLMKNHSDSLQTKIDSMLNTMKLELEQQALVDAKEMHSEKMAVERMKANKPRAAA